MKTLETRIRQKTVQQRFQRLHLGFNKKNFNLIKYLQSKCLKIHIKIKYKLRALDLVALFNHLLNYFPPTSSQIRTKGFKSIQHLEKDLSSLYQIEFKYIEKQLNKQNSSTGTTGSSSTNPKSNEYQFKLISKQNHKNILQHKI